MNFFLNLSKRLGVITHAKRCSPLIEGAWAGRLVHLSGFDVVGATAGSLSRLFQDREIELWEAKRVVSGVDPEGVRWSV